MNPSAIIKAIAIVGAVLVVAALAAIQYFHLPQLTTIFVSQAAKLQCTNVFVAGRDPDLAYEQDFRRLSTPGKYLAIAKTEVDHDNLRVTASLFGVIKKTAIFREGIGCTAATGVTEDELRAQGEGVATRLPPPDPNVLWPEGDGDLIGDPSSGVDQDKMLAAFDRAFSEPEPERPRKTRGAIVIHNDRIVAERYARGFDKTTSHLSNSVAKSVTNALVGILVGEGRLDLYAPAPAPEWSMPDDPRRNITLDNLMRMSSGLSFEESYVKTWSDISRQYIDGDLAGYAASQPLEAPPGTRWQYSTGTSNILGRIVQDAAGGGDLSAGFAFPRQALFEPIGMRTGVLEVDGKGSFVGGSFFHASVRDYARLGLLFLHDGIWNGERILPEGWVDYTTTLTPNGPVELGYGAQFWLNTGGAKRRWPELPEDTYVMNGHQGQHVIIVPSRNAVIVRVGLSEFGNWNLAAFAAEALDALPPPEPVTD